MYCTYDHNRPLDEIKFVRVKHDFEKITQFDHRLLFPQTFPMQFDYSECNYVFSSDVPNPMDIGKNKFLHKLYDATMPDFISQVQHLSFVELLLVVGMVNLQ